MILDDTFLNAYTYGFCEKRGFTRGTAWRWSLRELVRTTGCNAIILPVCAWQDHTYSTQIDSRGPDVMDAADVHAVSEYARELDLKLILKAMVNCRDGYWRAYIHFFDRPVPVEPGWEDWFASWNEHVCRVADMAEQSHADMLCIGCEMVGTDHREQEWRRLVDRVRQHYHGPVTYNCDKYQEDRVVWWDALEIISSSGYYPMGRWTTTLSASSGSRRRRTDPSCSWNAAALRESRASTGPMTGRMAENAARRNRRNGMTHSYERLNAFPL